MRIAVLYVGSSLLAPLRNAEQEINRRHGLDLRVVAHNFGAVFSDEEWSGIETDLRDTDVVFVIHVMDGENAARLIALLDQYRQRVRALTPQDVLAAARKYLDSANMQIVAVGDRAQIESQAALFGELEVYDAQGKRLE